MGLQIGIVGLPNVGKSTLFNAITRAGAEAANYPFCTIEPNVGVVDVPDPRLEILTAMFKPRRTVPAAVTFVDIAGLVRGAAGGEGLGNKFLHHIREVDALAHVVRCFADPNVIHVDGGVDPGRDIETVNLELILADLESVERQNERNARAAKGADPAAQAALRVGRELAAHLGACRPARTLVPAAGEDRAAMTHMHLLTAKPVMYIANLPETDLIEPHQNPYYRALTDYAAQHDHAAAIIPISARIESELAELAPGEKAEFLAELGIAEAGLGRVIRQGYTLLGLITYFTCGEPEVRAWTISGGIQAPRAAAAIHTDMERGFIRAEVVSYEDLVTAGSLAKARELGLWRLEGKEYVVRDGDIMHFRFNV